MQTWLAGSAPLRRGDPERRIHALASLATAGPDELGFLASSRHAAQARCTRAGAVLAPPALAGDVPPDSAPPIEVEDAHRAFGAIARDMAVLLARPIAPGVHPSAAVAPGAELGRDVSIGPFVSIGEGARIGDGAVLGAVSRSAPARGRRRQPAAPAGHRRARLRPRHHALSSQAP
ncbi:MAG: LpxD N-terminal domain-containing protein [Burkholderiaceae bacterium]